MYPHTSYNCLCICIYLYSAQKNPAHYGLEQSSTTTAGDTEREAASTPHFDTLLEGLCIK